MEPQLLQALQLYEELVGPQKYRKVHTPFISDERLEDLAKEPQVKRQQFLVTLR